MQKWFFHDLIVAGELVHRDEEVWQNVSPLCNYIKATHNLLEGAEKERLQGEKNNLGLLGKFKNISHNQA